MLAEGEEERVVGYRRHGYANLREVVEVLEERRLAEENAVADRVGREERGRKVGQRAGLTRVGPKHKGVQASSAPEAIEGSEVCIEVVCPVRIRRVVRKVPSEGGRRIEVEVVLGDGLVVDGVKADDSPEEDVELGIAGGVGGDVKEGEEEVYGG